jgi:hypothetical protein
MTNERKRLKKSCPKTGKGVYETNKNGQKQKE